jgi:hypothetical protein
MASPTTAASVKFGATTLAAVASASANVSQSPIDITDVGATYKKMASGILEGSVDIELFWDTTATGHSTITSALSGTGLISSVEVIWASGKSIKGDGIVENLKVSVAPNGVAQASCSIRFANGSITITA